MHMFVGNNNVLNAIIIIRFGHIDCRGSFNRNASHSIPLCLFVFYYYYILLTKKKK